MNDTGDTILRRIFDVRDARAVVTGAASGLGYAMAEVLGECGARVTLADVDSGRLEEVTRELVERGVRARAVVTDVTDRDGVEALIAGVVGAEGGIDVLCANAGISTGPGVEDPKGQLGTVDYASWEKVLAINLDGVFSTLQAAAPVMRRQRSGRIIVTASIAGLRAEPVVDYGYIASKAAVINVVRHAAVDLAPYGVHVNAIAPGPFKTRIATGHLPDPETERMWASLVPIGRMAETDELKGLVLLLASPAASFITGCVYPIDGGARAMAHAP